MYQLTGRLKFRNYKPLVIDKTMLFHTHNFEGTSVIYTVGYVPPTNQDTFIELNGYPVEPYLEYDGQIIAEGQEMIGWFDAGEHTDEFYDITTKEINKIVQDFDGWVMFEADVVPDEEDEDMEIVIPTFIEDKVVLSYPNDDEYDVEFDEEAPEIDSAGFIYQDNFQNEKDEKVNPDDLWNP